MNSKMSRVIFLIIFASLAQGAVFAEELKPVTLPAPQTSGGKPLMQALNERKSAREFSVDELSPQTLSDLLWAANGINRSDGRRTAPSAHNAQEIDIYVATKEALYLYNAKRQELTPVLGADIRSSVGKQAFVKDAPVGLIFVADLAKLRGGSEEDAVFYSATDTGYISQNVYLYCSSAGLSTVVLGWVDKEELAKAMKLRPDQRVILTQPVGYPKK
jgi:SagB-type dehydrogenase family enzyme